MFDCPLAFVKADFELNAQSCVASEEQYRSAPAQGPGLGLRCCHLLNSQKCRLLYVINNVHLFSLTLFDDLIYRVETDGSGPLTAIQEAGGCASHAGTPPQSRASHLARTDRAGASQVPPARISATGAAGAGPAGINVFRGMLIFLLLARLMPGGRCRGAAPQNLATHLG